MAAAPDADAEYDDDDRPVETVDTHCTARTAAAAGCSVPRVVVQSIVVVGAVAGTVLGHGRGPIGNWDDERRVSSRQTDRDSRSLDRHSCALVEVPL